MGRRGGCVARSPGFSWGRNTLLDRMYRQYLLWTCRKPPKDPTTSRDVPGVRVPPRLSPAATGYHRCHRLSPAVTGCHRCHRLSPAVTGCHRSPHCRLLLPDKNKMMPECPVAICKEPGRHCHLVHTSRFTGCNGYKVIHPPPQLDLGPPTANTYTQCPSRNIGWRGNSLMHDSCICWGHHTPTAPRRMPSTKSTPHAAAELHPTVPPEVRVLHRGRYGGGGAVS